MPAGPPQRIENGTLAVRLATLSERRQQIIRPVLENPRKFVLLRVRDLAAQLDSDAATIVRIVRGLGFGSYRDFQHHLHEASVAQTTSLDTMQAGAGGRQGRGSPVRDSLEQDVKNLGVVRGSVGQEQLLDLARRLHEARRIFVFGGDVASALAVFLEYNLSVVGLPVFAGTGFGRILHLARGAKQSDVAIGISFRRGLRMTVEGMKRASANGAYCVAIADSLVSPLARFADACFIAPIETPSFGVSYVAPMALLNALLAAYGQTYRTSTLALLREVDEEQRHGARWYLDGAPE